MKRIFAYIILSVLSVTVVCAAPSKRLTKRYKGARMEVVLQDLAKATGYKLNIAPEVNVDVPVYANFKEASPKQVLSKILDSNIQYTIKKGVVTISPKTISDTTYVVQASTPSDIANNDTATVTTWLDTVYTIRCHYEQQPLTSVPVREEPNNDFSLKGHHLQSWLGLGYGSMGYKLRNADNSLAGAEVGFAAGKVQLNYAWYFTENWALAAGVGCSNYTSTGTLNTSKQWTGITDTDGENYTHIAQTHDWRERQTTLMIDIPVMIQMQYPLVPKWNIYAGLGAKIGLPIANRWSLNGGQVEHKGYYPQWNLLLEGVDKHDFYTEEAASFGTSAHALSLRMPAAAVMAEIGFTRVINPQIELITALFFDYTVHSIRPSNSVSDGDMGWQRTDQTDALAYRNHTFMPPYNGIIMSEYVTAVRPWAIGIKVGISWHPKAKTKPAPPQFENVMRCDTSFRLDERMEYVRKYQPAVVQQIVKLMEKAVIWFDLNSIEPKLEPADILIKIAGILNQNPNQKILVYGHASKEGNERYNQRLSDQRASVITKMLIDLGVNPNQITQKGFAATISYQQGEHAISLDRRVEIIPVLNEE